jgi:hypothetical protein
VAARGPVFVPRVIVLARQVLACRVLARQAQGDEATVLIWVVGVSAAVPLRRDVRIGGVVVVGRPISVLAGLRAAQRGAAARAEGHARRERVRQFRLGGR